MNTNKVLGYILLVCGLLLVLFTIYQSYNIFYNKVNPPYIFKIQTVQKPQTGGTQDIQQQVNNEVSKQINQMIPADTVSKILNLLSWSILAGILIFGGAQIAGLGIKLIKV